MRNRVTKVLKTLRLREIALRTFKVETVQLTEWEQSN
jgi:hypothetical protein